MSLQKVSNSSEGTWLRNALDSSSSTLSQLVPSGYEAYVRVLNPIICESDGFVSRLTWAFAAKRAGVQMHAWIQWADIANSQSDPLPDEWGPPDAGNLDSRNAQILMEILMNFTSTPDRCTFAVWEGYADTVSLRDTKRVTLPPNRVMLLLTGEIQDAVKSCVDPEFAPRLPLRWWPIDHSWCVGNDIYARSVLVGGSLECINEILNVPDLEAFAVSISDDVVPEDHPRRDFRTSTPSHLTHRSLDTGKIMRQVDCKLMRLVRRTRSSSVSHLERNDSNVSAHMWVRGIRELARWLRK